MATLDLKPRETILGAYTSKHCQELFGPTRLLQLPLVHPPQSRKRSPIRIRDSINFNRGKDRFPRAVSSDFVSKVDGARYPSAILSIRR